MTNPQPNAYQRLIGMLRSPRRTLTAAVAHSRSLDLGALIVLIVAVFNLGFLLTPVGRLAALDQMVRQLESLGIDMTDGLYRELREWQRYRAVMSGLLVLVGWPIAWLALSGLVRALGNRATGRHATFAEVFTIVVHSSSVLALRAAIAAPVNYARESLGGATSLAMFMPGFGESTFAARLFSSIDLFAVWWIVLLAMGLGIVYQVRTLFVARWLFGAYATVAAALAATQALRGGI